MKRKTRITLEDRVSIETLLNQHQSIRYIASYLNKSPSTILREIQNHVQIQKATQVNCKNRKNCTHMNLCKSETCKKQCKYCIYCKKHCLDYEEIYCDKLLEAPHLCNGCPKKVNCHFEHRIYRAKAANTEYQNTLIEKRSGFDISAEELEQINTLVSPLLQNGLSVYHVKQTLGDSIPVSEATLRRMISSCSLDARNIDLREQVKRKPRKKKMSNFKNSIAPESKVGHLYDDYLQYIQDNETMVVQMDCVEGKKEEKATLLTLHFPIFHLQLAFIMNEHTSSCVIDVFNKIETTLGQDLFKETFPVILTDNGHEFSDVEGLERSVFGGQRTKIFYCEPNRSDEKGSCENNHKLIRYILPKGSSFEPYNQSDISLMMNHINSYARKSLLGKSPYEVAMTILPSDFFLLLGLELIAPQNIVLNKTLLMHI